VFDLPADFEPLLRLLSDSVAKFVVVGGVALLLHGGDNLTFDLDISFNRDREDTEILARALSPQKPRLRGFPPDLPFVFDAQTLRNAVAITLETMLGDFDMLAEPAGVDSFHGLYERSVLMPVAGMNLHIASLPDLMAMKRAANRPKDQTHIMIIAALMKLQEGSENP